MMELAREGSKTTSSVSGAAVLPSSTLARPGNRQPELGFMLHQDFKFYADALFDGFVSSEERVLERRFHDVSSEVCKEYRCYNGVLPICI